MTAQANPPAARIRSPHPLVVARAAPRQLPLLQHLAQPRHARPPAPASVACAVAVLACLPPLPGRLALPHPRPGYLLPSCGRLRSLTQPLRLAQLLPLLQLQPRAVAWHAARLRQSGVAVVDATVVAVALMAYLLTQGQVQMEPASIAQHYRLLLRATCIARRRRPAVSPSWGARSPPP